jgi:membrane-associated phospholipid phosphatase
MDIKAIFYDWNGVNTKLFHLLNGINDPVMNQLMVVGALVGKHHMFFAYFPLLIVAAWYDTFRHGSKNENHSERRILWAQSLLVLLLAYGAILLWVPFLKDMFAFSRPFAALPEGTVNVLDNHARGSANASFPSGHAIFAMTMAAGIWPVLTAPYRWLAAAFVVWICVSRIVVGAHFPADVAVGAALALASVLIIRAIVTTAWRRQAL